MDEVAQKLRREIIKQDLGLKEVADKIHRGQTTVKQILRGESVSEKTLERVKQAFPSVFV